MNKPENEAADIRPWNKKRWNELNSSEKHRAVFNYGIGGIIALAVIAGIGRSIFSPSGDSSSSNSSCQQTAMDDAKSAIGSTVDSQAEIETAARILSRCN